MIERSNPNVERAYPVLDRLINQLWGELNNEDHWSGELSSSALSTAVATIALGELDRQLNTGQHSSFVERGLLWLAQNTNPDGGWGDTIRSKSNISTTALCWAAFGAAGADDRFQAVVQRAEAWLMRAAGSMEKLPRAIAERYGKDRTFSVPILMACALSGRLDAAGWRNVPALPFELAVFPRWLFGALRLPVVSYALPALIAIGQVIHHRAPSRNPVTRFLRNAVRGRTLNLLTELQPTNGGFLEATPLTAFVTMSLAAAGQAQHSVADKGGAFLRNAVRPDGSWPIDTNLSTWVTTLAIKALPFGWERNERRNGIQRWLLNQQYKTVHPYTGVAPGGWAWTDLPGGVPDADDTAGALMALAFLRDFSPETINAAELGVTWLLTIQNADGGTPTFCRGWGALPFDRSTPEITAHVLRAFYMWHSRVNPALRLRMIKASASAIGFLRKSQRPNGSFVPLWFGNEQGHDDENPVYGTAQVLIALNQVMFTEFSPPKGVQERAMQFLIKTQDSNGGWGGDKGLPETIEETSLALEALGTSGFQLEASERALARLVELIEEGGVETAAPIGFYFARLWYYERLYPLIFSVSALRTALPLRMVHAKAASNHLASQVSASASSPPPPAS